MLADFLSKPTQGQLFRRHRDVLLGYAHVSTLLDPPSLPLLDPSSSSPPLERVVEQPSPPSPDQVQTDPWITVTRRKPHKSSGTNPTDPTVSFHPDLVSAVSVS
jgi:hypothetical protein